LTDGKGSHVFDLGFKAKKSVVFKDRFGCLGRYSNAYCLIAGP
jgi:hypothetical protein